MRTKRFIGIVALLTLFGSVMVIAGWIYNINFLINVIPREVNVVPDTAFGFILCSMALLVLIQSRRPLYLFLLMVFCGLIFLNGTASLYQYASGIDTGIENIFRPFIHQATVGLSLRMSIGTSICFTLIGPAMLLTYSGRLYLQKAAQLLLHTIILITILAIFGYLYSVPVAYKISPLSPMALRTSLSFLLISLSTCLLMPQYGIIGLLSGPNIGNVMARRLFPFTLVALFLVGYIRLQSIRLHLVSEQSGVIFVFIAIFLVSLFVIWNTATVLNGIDVQRVSAQQEVENLNKSLLHINEDLKGTMQKLEVNNQYLEQLAYISAHDIKSPILTLKGLVNILDTDKAVREGYTEMLSMITGTVNQMQRTNNSLNNILKLRKNLLTPGLDAEQGHTLQIIIEDIKTTLRPEIEACGGVVEFNIDPKMLAVKFPYVHLKSAFYNLLNNSIKYRDINKPLRVLFTAKKLTAHTFEFCIEDNGIGIDIEKNKDKIFGIFKRFHDHVEGSGVGLHMVKSIVEAYGGDVSVTSKPGQGTCFTITWNNLILV